MITRREARRAPVTSVAAHGAQDATRHLGWLLLAGALATQTLAAQSTASPESTADVARLIGLSVAASGGPRDTLGLLVASVTRDSPADQAGLTMGSRILAVNGYLVRLAPQEIGQRAAADTAMARFDRAIRTTPNGGSVALRIIGFGRTRTVTVAVPDGRVAYVRSSAAPAAGDAAPRVAAPASVVTVPAAASAPAPSAPAAAVPAAVPVIAAAPAPATAAAPENVAAPAAVVRAAGATASPDAAPVRTARSAGAIADALGEAQLDLRRLSRDTHSLAMSDSLAELDMQLGALRRRLKALAGDGAAVRQDSAVPTPVASTPTAVAPATPAVVPAPAVVTAPTPAPVPTPAPTAAPVSAAPVSAAPVMTSGTSSVRIAVDGLELTSVSGELAAYIGAQAGSSLVVTRASEAWEPMRAGDVVLQVDGRAPDPTGLRLALEAKHPISMLLLRRGRQFTVTFGEQQSP